MKKKLDIDFEKLKATFLANQKLATLFLILLVLGAIYILGKREDSRVVTYHEKRQPDFSNGRILDSSDGIYKKKDRIVTEKLNDLEEQIRSLTEKMTYQGKELKRLQSSPTEEAVNNPNEPISTNPIPLDPPTRPLVTEKYSPDQLVQTQAIVSTPRPAKSTSGPAVITFPVKSIGKEGPLGVKLPSGSFVKAKLLTGVEAPEGKALPVLLQADYAFVGPNKTKIDLSGCFLIAKSTGNLSIERVEMQATKISCVSKSGRMFERDLSGFVADSKDNSFAVIGDVNSKQDRVAAMAFLSSIVEGIGGAISQAQTSTMTNAVGGSSLAITGDQKKFIAASGASNAAAAVTSWYLKHAENLLPTINIGSGQDLWVIVQDSIELPNWYFKKTQVRDTGFKFLSNIFE